MGKKKIEFNFNDYIWLKLTEEGKKIYRDYFKSDFSDYDMLTHVKNEDGFYRFQAWSAMQVFGKHLRIGCNALPFSPGVFFEVEE